MSPGPLGTSLGEVTWELSFEARRKVQRVGKESARSADHGTCFHFKKVEI